MITLEQILNSQSTILEGVKVKVVRHKDSRTEYRDILKDREQLLEYQRGQKNHVFKDCDYIISFIGLERKRSLFIGVFKVGDYKKAPDNHRYNHLYDLTPVHEFKHLEDRLIIDWGKNAISWHQWYDKQPKEVIEILPQGYIGDFPGLLNFTLDFDELKILIDNPDANFDWKNHLSSVNGVYMILDTLTGQQYIGSANGKNGIWQRWCDYARTYTGDNKKLVQLIKQDPNYHKNFRFSILQTLPSNITQKEIVAIENLYKRKLGSKSHGLNNN